MPEGGPERCAQEEGRGEDAVDQRCCKSERDADEFRREGEPGFLSGPAAPEPARDGAVPDPEDLRRDKAEKAHREAREGPRVAPRPRGRPATR